MAITTISTSYSTISARPLWRFGLVSGGLVLLWAVGAAYGLGVNSPLDSALCRQLAASSAWGLRALGWQASVSPTTDSLLLLNGLPSVIVGPACDGLVLYALLAGFVLAYPGPARRRLWFIPLGIALLWLLNVVRIVALALNHRYSPETFDFDHHYAFSAVAYAALGGLWLLWTRQSQPVDKEHSTLPRSTHLAPPRPWLTGRLGAGALVLVGLLLVSVYQASVVAALGAGWAALLSVGPAWLHQLPGAAAGTVPAGVSRLPGPVGAAYVGLFVSTSLLGLRLLLPNSAWRLVWRSYAGLALACVGLLVLGRAGGGAGAYRLSRMFLDFLVSLLPVAGLLVLLWRPGGATSQGKAEAEVDFQQAG